ncbi:MAG: ion transporter [Bacteroidota bacterium]
MFKKFFLSDWNMNIAILVNAIVIFFLYFPQIKVHYPDFYHFLEYLDVFFILVFLIEAILKLQNEGFRNYFSSAWNQLDFWVVLFSLPSLLHFIPGFGVIHTSLFKVLRLIRLIRLVRFMHVIPNMDMILAGLGRAIRSSVFVLLVLFFMNFILAIFTCHFYGNLVPQYFGDPLISSYYIFQMFTIEGWNEIPAVIAEAAAEQDVPYAHMVIGMTRFYFILVVLLGGIFGMSLANAIFVDEMTMDNNRDLEKKITQLQGEIRELKDLLLEGREKKA